MLYIDGGDLLNLLFKMRNDLLVWMIRFKSKPGYAEYYIANLDDWVRKHNKKDKDDFSCLIKLKPLETFISVNKIKILNDVSDEVRGLSAITRREIYFLLQQQSMEFEEWGRISFYILKEKNKLICQLKYETKMNLIIFHSKLRGEAIENQIIINNIVFEDREVKAIDNIMNDYSLSICMNNYITCHHYLEGYTEKWFMKSKKVRMQKLFNAYRYRTML